VRSTFAIFSPEIGNKTLLHGTGALDNRFVYCWNSRRSPTDSGSGLHDCHYRLAVIGALRSRSMRAPGFSEFRKSRAFLVGDASHIHSPDGHVGFADAG
jgi:2-polyprenyl-6-methoxyphenol hydroxylase-like FAD-dependent oxidoreductase